MLNAAETWCHANSGVPEIDSTRFLQQPAVEPFRHVDTGILLYRLFGFGKVGTMTAAARGSGEPDLLILSRGAGVPAHGTVAGTRLAIKPNNAARVTFVPEDAEFSLTFGVSALSTNLIFPPGYLAGLLDGQCCSTIAPLLFDGDERLVRLVRLIETEVVTPGFASELMVEGLSRAIATLLARCQPAKDTARFERVHLPPWRLKRVTDFVEANLAGTIGLADMAACAGLSAFHFSRVFKLATGQSPYHYVRERRLQRSRELLAQERITIAELALVCGFANQSHFTAAFTRATGMSPGRYRRLVLA